MLHTVSHSLYQIDVDALLQSTKSSDCILLIQDSVVSAISSNKHLELLLDTKAPIYALCEDVVARGLTLMVDIRIPLVNYKGFVKLTAQHLQQMSW